MSGRLDALRVQDPVAVFNFDSQEVAANPVHLMYVLEQQIEREQFPPETEQKYLSFIKDEPGVALRRVHRQGDPDRVPGDLFGVRPEHLRPLRHLRRLLDPGPGIPRHDTGEVSTARVECELEKIEKPAGISNPKDFRNEIVNFVLRARAANGGKNPAWISYEKLRVVIEKKMFSNTEELLPVISFNAKGDRRTSSASTKTSSTAWCRRATRPSRCAAVRLVSARAEVVLCVASFIVIRSRDAGCKPANREHLGECFTAGAAARGSRP
jgi:hypothetical protein